MTGGLHYGANFLASIMIMATMTRNGEFRVMQTPNMLIIFYLQVDILSWLKAVP